MSKIVDKKGEINLSYRKIINMGFIVLFFTFVAKKWEFKNRRKFKKAVKFRKYETENLRQVLADFKILSICQDPYIENFYNKHPDFATLHKLWVLNSHSYWTNKFNREIQRRANR